MILTKQNQSIMSWVDICYRIGKNYVLVYVVCKYYIFKYIYISIIYIPRPPKGFKFQPRGLFLVVKGLKFQTLGGFRYVHVSSPYQLQGCTVGSRSMGFPTWLMIWNQSPYVSICQHAYRIHIRTVNTCTNMYSDTMFLQHLDIKQNYSQSRESLHSVINQAKPKIIRYPRVILYVFQWILTTRPQQWTPRTTRFLW